MHNSLLTSPCELMRSFRRLRTIAQSTNRQRIRITCAHISKKGSREHLVHSLQTGPLTLSSFAGKLKVISLSCAEPLGCQIWDLAHLSISTSLHHASQQ